MTPCPACAISRRVPTVSPTGRGFVTRVVADPRAAAFETAKEIASKSPDAIRAAKRILNHAVAVDAATGLMAESVEQQKLIGSPNQLEAVMSNLQKRAARYKD